MKGEEKGAPGLCLLTYSRPAKKGEAGRGKRSSVFGVLEHNNGVHWEKAHAVAT